MKMIQTVTALTLLFFAIGIAFFIPVIIIGFGGCHDKSADQPEPVVLHPVCLKAPHIRVDAHTPESMVGDWGTPIRLGEPINTPCPEDAIEISRDGQYLYFMFTSDLLENMTPAEILARENNTYRSLKIGGAGDFDQPVYYDLAKGTNYSLDGELSFAPDGSQVFFHSNRPTNIGYQQDPPTDDFLDIYVADIVDGRPGAGRNLGRPVNSEYPDGEHALHPDGRSLYLTSYRPGGAGGADIWVSQWEDSVWSEPVNLGAPINTIANEGQPAFTVAGDTVYFTSNRDITIGSAIYRSHRVGDLWSEPELVIKGIVGEPSLTADGGYLYFVHVLSDTAGTYDADIWYSPRVR